MSPEVSYEQVAKQDVSQHPLRRGRTRVVPYYSTANLYAKSPAEEEKLASLRQELATIESKKSQELFAAGLAVQLFLSIAMPHAGLLVSLFQEAAMSTLEDPTGEDIDRALLRGTIGQGVTAVTGVG